MRLPFHVYGLAVALLAAISSIARGEGRVVRSPEFGDGIVLPAADITIRAKTTGEIMRLNVEEGDRVEKGDTLAVLDNEINEIQLEQAQNTLKSQVDIQRAEAIRRRAEIELQRNDELYKKNIISEQDIENYRINLKLAEIDVNKEHEAKTQQELAVRARKKELADTQIRSPISGAVVKVLKHQGEIIEQLEDLLEIVNADEVLVQFDLPVEELPRVRLGTKAEVRVEVLSEEKFLGVVSYVSPVVDPRSRTFRVKIKVPNPRGLIRPGLSATTVLLYMTQK